MSQLSEFAAQVRSELLARHAGNLGWCAACGGPVLVEDNFMHIEGRVAHVDCRPAQTGPATARSRSTSDSSSRRC